MAGIKKTEDSLILTCDCGAVYTITKDDNGELKLTGKVKKPPEPPEPPEPPKPKGIFDVLLGGK